MKNILIVTLVILVFGSCSQNETTHDPNEEKILFDESYKPAQFTGPSRIEKIKKAFPVIDSLYKRHALENHFPGIAFGLVVDDKLVLCRKPGLYRYCQTNPRFFFFIVSHCFYEQELYSNGYFKIA